MIFFEVSFPFLTHPIQNYKKVPIFTKKDRFLTFLKCKKNHLLLRGKNTIVLHKGNYRIYLEDIMQNLTQSNEKEFLGEHPPLYFKRANQKLERRQVSFRWLAGTVLTAVTSTLLMGGALFAALDGRQKLTIPAHVYNQEENSDISKRFLATKGARPSLNTASNLPSTNNIMIVPTVSREGTRDVVREKPFLHVLSPLAVATKSNFSYPTFNPLTIFSANNQPELIARSSGLIYGADVEGEITFTTKDFPYDSPNLSLARQKGAADIEELVRNTAPQLNIGSTSLVSVAYFDPRRFTTKEDTLLSPTGAIITAENVSTLSRSTNNEYIGIYYEERLIRLNAASSMSQTLNKEGIGQEESSALEDALSSNLSSQFFQQNDRLRIFFEVTKENNKSNDILNRSVARISVYRAGAHMVSIAKTKNGGFRYAQEPARIAELSIPDKKIQLVSKSALPTIYDAIYRTSLNEGIPPTLIKELIRIVSFDVDFKTRIRSTDGLSVFLNLEKGEEKPTEQSDILYAAIKLGSTLHRYYRYLDHDTGKVDYYNENGKSAKQFLLRQPVPNGRFTSPFGMRRHPVTRVRKMHSGVDWAAPRGTPILAAGNGAVEKASWAGGSGRRTILRHANGYKTYYLHQTRFAKGIKEGVRVRQGQIIGYVGSTGLSTGPHLHYEVAVNGNKVNPMRIKLPSGKTLKGSKLTAFKAERDRIDELLKKRQEENQMVVALN